MSGANKPGREITFEVMEDIVDGGYYASALEHSIHTQGSSLEELRWMVRDAVECHFDPEEDRPTVARLHFTWDETLAV